MAACPFLWENKQIICTFQSEKLHGTWVWRVGLRIFMFFKPTLEKQKKTMRQGMLQNNMFCLKINKKYAKYCFGGKTANGEFCEKERQEVYVSTMKRCN